MGQDFFVHIATAEPARQEKISISFFDSNCDLRNDGLKLVFIMKMLVNAGMLQIKYLPVTGRYI